MSSEHVADRIGRHRASVARLARVSEIELVEDPVPGSVQIVAGDVTAYLHLGDVIDIGGEKDRLARELEKAAKEIAKIDAKLENEQFIEKAPIEIIEEQRERRREAVAHSDKLRAAIERLEG